MDKDRKAILKRFTAACGYVAAPGLTHTEAVIQEVRDMIPDVPGTSASIEAIVETNRLDLIKEFEKAQGPRCWMLLEFSTAGVLSRLEEMKLKPSVRDYAYRSALASRPKLMEHDYMMMVSTACTNGSKTLFRLIMENHPPSIWQLKEMLLDLRVMESSAFRGSPDHMAAILTSANFGEIDLSDLTLKTMNRRSIRGMLLLAKLGHARYTPVTLGLSKQNLDISERLNSNHGRLALMTELPDLKSLISMGGTQLHKKIYNAL